MGQDLKGNQKTHVQNSEGSIIRSPVPVIEQNDSRCPWPVNETYLVR